jgi:ribonuclease HII
MSGNHLSAGRNKHMMTLAATDSPYRAGGARVAGMDEAGRGPLAGDVVAACVIMPEDRLIPWVDDSKKLSPARRAMVYEQIMGIALFVGVGKASAEEIDAINILQATKNAMRRAAADAGADIYLLDAVSNLGLCGQEYPIIHGDALSYSIAAASIIAKVTRDRDMEALDSLYPQYGFMRHKGYGTPEHIAALKAFGPCPAHRRSFIGHFCRI